MIKHGKSYFVRKRRGETTIIRDGKAVGTWPETGYHVQVKGVCTALAGTLIAAHALAEVYLGIEPQSRRFVLTEAEYEEHMKILENDVMALIETFPYSREEEESVKAHDEKYADIIRQGSENLKQKLMNVNPYPNVVWDPDQNLQPNEIPQPIEDEAPASMRL